MTRSKSRRSQLPLPPADIGAREPVAHVLPKGAWLSRFFNKSHHPIFFDFEGAQNRSRFNSPTGTYGVLYAAEESSGAFAESFLRVPGRAVAPDLIAAKSYARFKLLREVRLAMLRGNGLARIGATAEVIHCSPPYGPSQSWSQALHDHPMHFDGISYTSRHAERLCVALFDRARDASDVPIRRDNLLDDWFDELLDRDGVGVAPG